MGFSPRSPSDYALYIACTRVDCSLGWVRYRYYSAYLLRDKFEVVMRRRWFRERHIILSLEPNDSVSFPSSGLKNLALAILDLFF